MIIRNKYEVLERIGVGGMGVVYKGRHVTFNELCAIKIVSDVIAGDAKFLQRFQTEAVVTRKLRHPNAVRVDDFDYTEDGRPFIVMELVVGKNIGEVLQEEGPLRASRAVRIATQAARALGVAHKLGVVHRDIKPGNIILTIDEQGQETAKVLDFGIAKLREAAGNAQPGMTMTGMVVGTPLYMSPEQFMGKKAGEEIDGRTDIYSLGVVLYQMVTARVPFEGDTLYALMMQHMEGTTRLAHEVAPELQIPESLSRVILKAIDKSREKRFQTAEEFIAALDQVANDPATNEQAPLVPRARMVSDELSPEAFNQATSDQVADAAHPTLEGSSLSPLPARPVPSVAAGVLTPPPSAGLPSPTPVAPQASVALGVPSRPPSAAIPVESPAQLSAAATPPPSAAPASQTPVPPAPSVLVKSAAQHLFLQPRAFRMKHILILVALGLAMVLIAGLGYVKYQALRRLRIEDAVTEKLNTAPSLTLRKAGIRVFVSDAREVILDGNVKSIADASAAESLAASVPDVTHVTNRVRVVPAVAPAIPPAASTPSGAPPESADSLINRGTAFLDTGDYASAIDCFTKAVADPSNKGAQELLDRARRAQKTEEDLLRKRR